MGVSGWPLAVSPVAVQHFLGYWLFAASPFRLNQNGTVSCPELNGIGSCPERRLQLFSDDIGAALPGAPTGLIAFIPIYPG